MTAIPITIVITGLDPVIHLLRKSLLRRLMDARIKSGHDERFSRSEVKARFALKLPIQFSNSKNNSKYGFAFSRRAAPEVCMKTPPPRGRGECRMPAAPAASCALCSVRTHTSNNEYTGITRHSRTQWF
jgi:hypothetical protein